VSLLRLLQLRARHRAPVQALGSEGGAKWRLHVLGNQEQHGIIGGNLAVLQPIKAQQTGCTRGHAGRLG
jgi:hypothetical protein